MMDTYRRAALVSLGCLAWACGGELEAVVADVGDAEVSADLAVRDTNPSPRDAEMIEPMDLSVPADGGEMDAGATDAGEMDAGPLNLESPLSDNPRFERVLHDTLVQSVDVLHWLPEEDALQFSVGQGTSASVERLTREAYEGGRQAEQRHPYSTWRIDFQGSTPSLREAFRLPAHWNGLNETNWCRFAVGRRETWCNHNFKKSDEWLLRVRSGDGITEPIQRDRWRNPQQHSNFIDFEESAAGDLYLIYKRGISGRHWIFRLDGDAVRDSSGGAGRDVLDQVTEPCADPRSGTCTPTEDISGLPSRRMTQPSTSQLEVFEASMVSVASGRLRSSMMEASVPPRSW